MRTENKTTKWNLIGKRKRLIKDKLQRKRANKKIIIITDGLTDLNVQAIAKENRKSRKLNQIWPNSRKNW